MATTYRLNCCPVQSTNRDGYEHDRDGHKPPLEVGARTNRVFLPSEFAKYGTPNTPPSEIIFYDSSEQISHLRHSTSYTPSMSKVEYDTLVISIDGKARREDTSLAQAVSGRYFGPNSEFNGAPASVRQTPQTKERAIIIAASSAVNVAATVIQHNSKIHKVIIMTHCDWLIDHMGDRVWDWLTHGFPEKEQLPNGVAPEEYRLTHGGFRQLEESNVAVLFWKVAAHSIPEPGRLANEHLDRLESDPEAQHEWETWYGRHVFTMMLRHMMLENAEADGHEGESSDSTPPCPCPSCDHYGQDIAKRSREEAWNRGDENTCPCSNCREFVRTHGNNPKDNAAKRTLGTKENQKPDQPVMAESSEKDITNSNTTAEGEHATVDEVDVEMKVEL